MTNPLPSRSRRRPKGDAASHRSGVEPRTAPLDPTAERTDGAAADRSDHQVVADNIAALRRTLGIPAEELAAACGVHVSLIERIEGGRTFLPAVTLARIAHALGVPVGRLHQP